MAQLKEPKSKALSDLQGFLWYEVSSFPSKWGRYFFNLKAGQLSYYENQHAGTRGEKPKGIYHLQNAALGDVKNKKKHEYCFKLSLTYANKSMKLILAADSKQEAHSWKQALSEHMAAEDQKQTELSRIEPPVFGDATEQERRAASISSRLAAIKAEPSGFGNTVATSVNGETGGIKKKKSPSKVNASSRLDASVIEMHQSSVIQDLKRKVLELEDELDSRTSRDDRRFYQKLEKDFEMLLRERDTLVLELDRERALSTQLEDELITLQNNRVGATLETRLLKAENLAKALSDENRHIEGENERLRKTVKDLKEDLTYSSTQRPPTELEKRLQSIEQRNLEVEEQAETLRKFVKRCKEVMEAADIEQRRLQREIDSLRDRSGRAGGGTSHKICDAEIARLKKTIANLANETVEKENTIRKLEDKMDTQTMPTASGDDLSNSRSKSKFENLKIQLKDLVAENEKLAKILKLNEEKYDALERDFAKEREENENLNGKIEDLQQQLSAQKQQMRSNKPADANEKIIQSLNLQIDQLREQLSVEQSEVAVARQQTDLNSSNLKKNSKKMEEIKEENLNLKEKLEVANRELTKYKNKYTELEGELAELWNANDLKPNNRDVSPASRASTKTPKKIPRSDEETEEERNRSSNKNRGHEVTPAKNANGDIFAGVRNVFSSQKKHDQGEVVTLGGVLDLWVAPDGVSYVTKILRHTDNLQLGDALVEIQGRSVFKKPGMEVERIYQRAVGACRGDPVCLSLTRKVPRDDSMPKKDSLFQIEIPSEYVGGIGEKLGSALKAQAGQLFDGVVGKKTPMKEERKQFFENFGIEIYFAPDGVAYVRNLTDAAKRGGVIQFGDALVCVNSINIFKQPQKLISNIINAELDNDSSEIIASFTKRVPADGNPTKGSIFTVKISKSGIELLEEATPPTKGGTEIPSGGNQINSAERPANLSGIPHGDDQRSFPTPTSVPPAPKSGGDGGSKGGWTVESDEEEEEGEGEGRDMQPQRQAQPHSILKSRQTTPLPTKGRDHEDSDFDDSENSDDDLHPPQNKKWGAPAAASTPHRSKHSSDDDDDDDDEFDDEEEPPPPKQISGGGKSLSLKHIGVDLNFDGKNIAIVSDVYGPALASKKITKGMALFKYDLKSVWRNSADEIRKLADATSKDRAGDKTVMLAFAKTIPPSGDTPTDVVRVTLTPDS